MINTEKTHSAIGAAVALAAMIFGASNANAYPKGYYNALNGKKGVELMHAVKSVVRNHTVISYGTKTWTAFETTDVRTVNGIDYWWDMYSNDLVEISSGHGGLNIEHSVANSWWGKTQNDAYKDIVHLNPSNANANSRKSNYPLCELATVKWNNGVTFVGTPKSGQGGGSANGYEPADEYKGDFARAFMYVFTTYNDIAWADKTAWMYDTAEDLMFRPWAQELLMRWSATDPVSDKERNRNEGIFEVQKNRNPFIDLPDLADHIWGDKKDEAFYADEGEDPEPGPDPDEKAVEYIWMTADATAIDPEWTISDQELSGGLSYIWAWRTNDNGNYLNGSAYMGNAPHAATSVIHSPEVSLENCTGAMLSFEHAARFQTTLQTLCRPVIREAGTDTWTELDVPKWPQSGKWVFTNSGDIDLSGWEGKKVHIGFKYGSTDEGADTWEIRNIRLTATRTSGIEEISGSLDDDDSFLVEVWGDCILAPEGARIFDLNGREVGGDHLQRGIYIVTKPSFAKSVKVMVK